MDDDIDIIPHGLVVTGVVLNKTLLGVPGAVKALAHVVGKTGEAGGTIVQAWGESVAQGIRDKAEGKSIMARALANAAADLGVSDPAMVQRAADTFAAGILKKQVNREAVARVAVEHLNEGDPIDPTSTGPTDDWLNFFDTIAERATSEALRDVLGRILNGEIRKPGSFSLSTIQFMSVLDKDVAVVIENMFQHIAYEDFIPFPNRFDYTDDFRKKSLLSQYGILTDSQNRRFIVPESGILSLPFKSLQIVFKCEPGTTVIIPVVALTRIGQEILPLLSSNTHQSGVIHAAEQIMKMEGVLSADIVAFDSAGGSPTLVKRLQKDK
ncbi:MULTISPECIES: DUF2806 domain-containing protein [unclassified Chelatococcus]|uniref:DUF2806 domain-containing protein n=1 Tax=unclassified Chelatococcus TaxID=2638111 RepID=UPI001BCD884D|nr:MULTISPECIES: DUF2806 domain-containing protein [unclassified Chelatococcus]MBS7699166.1 DUF2806 domain-containing protein [Chelatococcus sp. YT9]MBX3554947.1 DUF2806 domain-containing protein [Chelatococcus sp.]